MDILFFSPNPAFGYIGPGAGIVATGTGGLLLITLTLIGFTLFGLPLLWWKRWKKYRRPENDPRFDRVVILGFDGMDPQLYREFHQKEAFQYLPLLRFHELQTVQPPLSPVAWAGFLTGTNPGKHGIFDFVRQSDSGSLALSTVETLDTTYRSRRRSRSFFSILSEYGIPCWSLRIPDTFPPEPLLGAQLSGFPAPDILGTQGVSFLVMERNERDSSEHVKIIRSAKTDNGYWFPLPGPEGSDTAITLERCQTGYICRTSSETVNLVPNLLSPWITIEFSVAGKPVQAVARFFLQQVEPLVLYISPLNIDPRKPLVSLSYPPLYSRYLAEKFGPFSTLGMAEDISAMREGAITTPLFLEQCYVFQDEREALCLDALRKLDRGCLTFVFDLPDRAHHFFLQEPHTLASIYRVLDQFLGKVISQIETLPGKTLLLVLSDHGISSAETCVNLNSLLRDWGYLEGKRTEIDILDPETFNRDLSRAVSFGFNGIYLLDKSAGLREEIRKRLAELTDASGKKVFRNVYLSEEIYEGPYASEGPDIIVGYHRGFKTSFVSARGRTEPRAIFPNDSPWNADHSMDASEVPGVLFSNYPLQTDIPHLIDIAPTVLDAFGIKVPEHIDGRSLL